MSAPVNATNTRSPHFAEMVAWAEENIPESPGFYILHFESPIGEGNMGQAGHYCGSAENLRERFIQHLGGCGMGGARLTEVANERGIKFWMATALTRDTFQEAWEYEQYFKKCSKNGHRHCPLCGKKALPFPSKNRKKKKDQ